MAARLLKGKQLKDATITGAKIAATTITAGNVDKTGTWNFASGDVQVANSPAGATSAVNKGYVDGVAQGLQIKGSVRVVAVADVGTPTGLLTIDEKTLVDGERVLLTAQDPATENGIWIAHSGAWTRPTDFAAGSHAKSSFTFVEEGTTYADTGWVCTTNAPNDVVDTDSLAFTQFSGAGAIEAGAGLTKTGNTLNVGQKDGTGAGAPGGAIKVNADDIEVQVDGSTLEITDVLDEPGVIRVKDGGITGIKLAAAVAGAGLSKDGSNNLQVNAGNGIEIVTDNVSVKPDTTGGANLAKAISVTANGVAVKVDDRTITGDASTGQLTVGKRPSGDAGLAPLATSGDYATTGIAITYTPNGGRVSVNINGIEYEVGDGVRTKDCYFAVAGGGGAAARAFSAIIATDVLYWNGVIAGFNLETDDIVDLDYHTVS